MAGDLPPRHGIVREAFEVDEPHFDTWTAIAGAAATIVPMAVGLARHRPAIGLVAAIGGLNTALAVPRGDVRHRVLWGGLAAVGGGCSVALATVVGYATWALVATTFVWTAGWALARTGGKAGALAGFGTTAVFVILAGIPAGSTSTIERTLWFLAGALGGLVMTASARSPVLVRRPPSGGPVAPDPEHVPALVRSAVAGFRRAVATDGLLRLHALRLATAVAASTLVYRSFDLVHGYWVPLTVLAVLQPEERASEVRGVQRAAGTLGGTAVVMVIALATSDPWPIVAAAAVSAFLMFGLAGRGYFWLVVLLTPTALLMISAVDYQGFDIAVERCSDSGLGILIGVGFAMLWKLKAHPPGLPGPNLRER